MSGHLAFDHGVGGLQLDELARLIAPTLDPVLINHMLGRSTYGSPAEYEADAFADLVLAPRVFASAGSRSGRPPPTGSRH